MKREIKKKLINSTLVLSLTTAAITPVAIVLGKNRMNSIQETLLNNNLTSNSRMVENQPRSIASGNFNLETTDSILVGSEWKSEAKTISNPTPNTSKPIPKGYVTLTEGNTLICIDKNNPNKILWETDYRDNRTILAVEYTPYEDTLVVLYSNGARGNQSKVDIHIDKFKGISSKEGTISEDNMIKILEYTYNGGAYREDTWGLSPIYKTSTEDGDNAQVTSYLIYPRVHDQNNKESYDSPETKIFEYSIKDNYVSERTFSYSITNNYQAIMAMGSFIYGNNVHVVALIARKKPGSGKTWLNVEYFVQNERFYDRHIYESKGYRNVGGEQGDFLNNDWDYVNLGTSSNISGASFSYDQINRDMKVTFALNSFGGWISSSNFHEGNRLITTSVYPPGKVFSREVGPWENKLWRETWGGYFDNSVITKKGISGNGSGPLLLIGKDPVISNRGYEGRFTAIITDPTSYGNDKFVPSLSMNESSWRIYPQTTDSSTNLSEYFYYSNFGTKINVIQNDRLGYNQGAFGIPILEYNSENNNSNNLKKLNILFMKNGAKNAIIINQQNRGDRTVGTATYSYRTKLNSSTTSFSKYGDSNYSILSVDKEYIYKKLNISNTESSDDGWSWFTSDFLWNDIKLRNVRNDAKFRIKDLTRDLEAGSVRFELYTNTLYKDDGSLGYGSITNLEERWWPSHKIGTFTLTGFKPTVITKIKNPYKIDVEGFGSFPAYTLPPSSVTENGRAFWNLKETLWRSIAGGSNSGLKTDTLFENLRMQPPEYNQDTWTRDWDKFFNRFEVKDYDNTEGTVTVNFNVKIEYILNETEGFVGWNFNNVKLTGFKKTPSTKFKSNTKNTAFINADWSNVNIPYLDSKDYPSLDYLEQGTTLLQEDQLRTWLFDNYIKTAYGNGNKENQYEFSNDWVTSIANPISYIRSDSIVQEPPSPSNWPQLTSKNLKLSNWKFYPADGMLSVEVRLDVWMGDNQKNNNAGLRWAKGAFVEGVEGTDAVKNAPFGTWYVGGFRKDNVTTEIRTDVEWWDLPGVSRILASSALENAANRKDVRKAIIKTALDMGYIKLPFWVNPRKTGIWDDISSGDFGELNLISLESSDNERGTASLRISLRTQNWQKTNDGRIVNEGKDGKSWTINVKGFSKIKSIAIDSSNFYNVTLATQDILIAPNVASQSFLDWINYSESKIIDYVVEQDKLTNQDQAQSKDIWTQRIKFTYLLGETTDSTTEVANKNLLLNEISKLINSSQGSIGYMWRDYLNSGIKIWVRINDEQANNYLATIEGKPSNENKGKGLMGQLNTEKIFTNIDFSDWFRKLEEHKATSLVNPNEENSSAEGVLPPEVTQGVAANMPFSTVETKLKNFGYKFEYSWIDKTGKIQTSTNLPTNFTYNQSNPVIKLTIKVDPAQTPPLFIFGSSTETSKELTLSLAVKKMIEFDLNKFQQMLNSDSFKPTNKNIEISKNGIGNNTTIEEIKTKWTEFEDSIWAEISNNTSTSIEELKKHFQFKYDINNSGFNVDSNQVWDSVQIGWQQAIRNLNSIGKLRFYSPSITKGTRIRVTAQLIKPNDVDYNIKFKQDLQEANVNHGLSTTFDMSSYAKVWTATKTQVSEGSTFDSIQGFTPPADQWGNTFDDFVTVASNQLGMKFRYSNNGKKWVNNKNEITSVDSSNPLIYLSLSATYDDLGTWNNAFDIMNFPEDGNKTDITSVDSLWTEALALVLNLPQYLNIDKVNVSEYINSNPVSGNTKNIVFDIEKEKKLIDAIVKNNPPVGNNPTPTIWIEYLLGSPQNNEQDQWLRREDFVKTLAQFNTDQSTNEIWMRIVVDPINEKEPVYAIAEEKSKYELLPQNISSSAVVKIFVNKSNLETLMPQVSLSGSNTNFTWTWPSGLNIDNNSGQITSAPGMGLHVEYTFDENANVDAPSNENGWTKDQPHSYQIGQRLWIRLVANDGYVYEATIDNTYAKHEVDFSKIKEQVEVNHQWLNVPFIEDETNIKDITIDLINSYEDRVKQNIANNAVKQKVAIRYSFNGKENLSAEQLVDEIKHLNSTNDLPNLGIIQLWNGTSGLKINAKLTKADETSEKYELVEPTNKFDVDVNTRNVITTVDLQKLVTYLKNNLVKPNLGSQDLSIDSLNMPNFPGTIGDGPLQGYSWDVVQKRLDEIGISIKWKAGIDNAQWGNDQSVVNKYNDENPYFEIKFVLDTTKGINIKASIEASEDLVPGNESSPIKVGLKVASKITINQSFVDDFINANNSIGGNTKNIKLSKENEKQMLDRILEENTTRNPVFNDAKIYVEYQLGNSGWLKHDEFINYLSSQTNDQTTNKVEFRIAVENPDPADPNFAISQNQFVLAQEAIGQSDAKVKIYINNPNRNVDIEKLADDILIEGINDDFRWVMPNGLTIENGQVNNILGLKVQYTVDKNASIFDAIDDAKWTDQAPFEIDPSSKYLAIRFVATNGYVYGPQLDNSIKLHIINVDKIVSKIQVDNKALLNLVISGETNNIDWTKLIESEKNVINSLPNIDDKLKSQLEIKYHVSWQGKDIWLNNQELKSAIDEFQKNYNGETLGILKFDSSDIERFNFIEARFESKDPDEFIPIDPTLGTEGTAKGIKINTSNIITSIDFSKYKDVLENVATEFALGSSTLNVSGITPPSMTGEAGTEFLAGKTFDEIVAGLDKVGIEVQFQAPGKNSEGPTATGDNWVNKDQIKNLNQTNDLFIRFKVKDEFKSILASYKFNPTFNDEGVTDSIKLKVELPIVLIVNPQDLSTITIKGTTIDITNKDEIKTNSDQIIAQTKQNNSSNATNVDDADLQIEFSLNGLDIDGTNTIWYTIDDFATALSKSTINFNTNLVKARFKIVTPEGQKPKYQISTQNSYDVHPEEFNTSTSFKIYIHTGDYFTKVHETLVPTGSNEDYSFNNFDSWFASVPKGLKIEFSSSADPDNDNNAVWVEYTQPSDLPKPLDANKNLYIRFVTKDGYVFENQKSDTENVSSAIKLDTSQLKSIIKLELSWLEKIELTGNMKDITINEQPVIDAITAANIIPTGKDGLIEIQYTVDGQNWKTKNEFIAYLASLEGAYNDKNFILKRDSIKARYNINETINVGNEYILNIDNTNIDDNNRDSFNKNLVTDKLNTTVQGYININKLVGFVKDNFEISGTSTKAKFIVKDPTTLVSLLQVYASDNIFDILWTIKKDANGDAIWDPNQKIWDGTQFISQITERIPDDKFFAIKFVARDDSNYQVWHDNKLQNTGYTIDLTNNVHIIREIVNPFTANNKGLGLWFRNNDDTPRYYQSEGGFKLTLADVDGSNSDKSTNAIKFMKDLPENQLSQEAKEALEFVYVVFDNMPTTEEFAQISTANEINNYSADSKWKSLDQSAYNDPDGFSNSLGLKVNQFVAIALRVKEQYAPKPGTDEGFALTNDDHSILSPLASSNAESKGRVNGYKVNADEIKVDFKSIEFENIMNSTQDPLDGWTKIKSLKITPDKKDNYFGIELKLNLFNEFWNGKLNEPIITSNNIKLVKRDASAPGAIVDGYYKDIDSGNLNIQLDNDGYILDNQGNKIPVVIDNATKNPAKPLEKSTPTRSKMLTSVSYVEFAFNAENDLEQSEFALFNNQKIQIEYVARVGENVNNLPDFYLDKEYKFDDIKETTQKIKFPIDNPRSISYDFDPELREPITGDETKDKIFFKNSVDPNEKPIEGQAKIDLNRTILAMFRKEGISTGEKIEGISNLEKMLKDDFNGQLEFKVIYRSVDGGKPQEKIGLESIESLTSLKNGDRITISIGSSSSDKVFAQPPTPLTIIVNGLRVESLDQKTLQYLRVEQNGLINGQGSFKVLVNNPLEPNQDQSALLQGYKFQIRVWGIDKKIRYNWTDAFDTISDLSNGEKIEWRLVNSAGQLPTELYYNTIAQEHTIENSQIKFNFAQVLYVSGNNGYSIVSEGIGKEPTDSEAYPENSGFVIDNLREYKDVFVIDQSGFKKAMDLLNPWYEGINGQGAIRFNSEYQNPQNNYYVNSNGDIYKKSNNPITRESNITTINEIPVSYFLRNCVFYTGDASNEIVPGNEFTFSSNSTTTNNNLWNGQQIYATWLNVNNDDKIQVQLKNVFGLSEISDSMNPLWIVPIAIGSIATLGLLLLIYFIFRNKKLREK